MLNLTHYSNFYIFTILELKYFIFIKAELFQLCHAAYKNRAIISISIFAINI